MITLTQKSSSAPLELQLRTLRLNFRRLRQRSIWRDNVTGGIAVLEVTWNAVLKQFHPHIHVVATGNFIPQPKLAQAWSDVTHGSKIVDIRKIDSGERASKYLSTYLTKPPHPEILESLPLATEWYNALKSAHWCIRIGGLKIKIDEKEKEPEPTDWQQIGSLDKIIEDAESGMPSAIALLKLFEHGSEATYTTEITDYANELSERAAIRHFNTHPPSKIAY